MSLQANSPQPMPILSSKSPILLTTFLWFCSIVHTFADPPITDIVEVSYNHKKYYIAECLADHWVLKNHDLCYYDSNGNYMAEVVDVINYSQRDSITIYASMETINIQKLSIYKSYYDFDNVLKIMNEGITIDFQDFKDKFRVTDAYHGNMGMFTFTKELKTLDNIWIDAYPIETLFSLRGHEICTYGFFAIRGNVSKKEKNQLRKEIQYLLSKNELYPKFRNKISSLYKRNIIMVGHCSC